MKKLVKLIDHVLTEVSGKRAWDWVCRITQYHRTKGSHAYHEIAEKIIADLKQHGFERVELLKYPADGETKSWGWVHPFSWDVKSGELWITDPTHEVVCRFDEIPMCLMGFSQKCDVTTEIVDVGSGQTDAEYEGRDVTGKIVLMSGAFFEASLKFVEKGAVGAIIYPSIEQATGHRGLVRFNRFFPNKANLEQIPFGFSISLEQADYLKGLLAKGPVTVHAKINAEIYAGNFEVISTTIPGAEFPDQEIVVIAHLCHPAAGANDNASGAAGLLETAKSTFSLIKNGVIPPPKRTLRYLWVPEFYGTIPWAKAHEARMKKVLGNLNLDMIGEHPARIGTPCAISSVPYSIPSIQNDLVQHVAKIIADHPKGVAVNGTTTQMRYRFLPFSGGSDHQVFADAHFGIPGMMFGHEDPLWHTSLDTVEYCDPTEMQRVIGMAAVLSYTLATLSGPELTDIWPIVHAGIYHRLSRVTGVLDTLLTELYPTRSQRNENTSDITPQEKAALGLAMIAAASTYETKVLESLTEFGNATPLLTRLIEHVQHEIDQNYVLKREKWLDFCQTHVPGFIPESDPESFTLRYARKVEMLPPITELISLANHPTYQKIRKPEPPKILQGDFHETLNLVAHNLTLKEICGFLSIQYHHLFHPSHMQEFLDLLIEKDLIQKIAE